MTSAVWNSANVRTIGAPILVQWPRSDQSFIYRLFWLYSISTFGRFVHAYMSSTPWWRSGLTMPSVVLATLSQWPHQRTTQRNRNDRLFIIAQPLCRRGKSIIKTRLTAKITAVSSIVLEQANFFFPQGSLDQSSITLVQFAPHLKSHCLLELDLPESFTRWMDSPPSKKKKKKEILCEIAWGVRRFWICTYPSLSAINLPTGRMSSLHGRTGAFLGLQEEVTARTGHWNKEEDMNGNVYLMLTVDLRLVVLGASLSLSN